MKILHICVSSYYTEGMSYQDNIIPDINASDGHSVTIVSNASKYNAGIIVQTGEQDIYLKNGIRLVRKQYLFGKKIGSKIKAICGLRRLISDIQPDVILHHGTGGLSLLSTVNYKKDHPKVKLYIDSHEDYHNSARNWISKNIQHKLIHGPISRYACNYCEKILYISEECKEFLIDLYHIPIEKLEFYPLGGIIISDIEKCKYREKVRAELGIDDSDILLCHTGKLDVNKKTENIILAFDQIRDERLKLIIIGSLTNETEDVINEATKKDKRIKFLGWNKADELIEYICASDMYVQPGTQSATMQNAICCGIPVMLYPYKSHQAYLKGNGWFVESVSDIVDKLNEIVDNPEILIALSANSYQVAYELLDYRKLAARLYQ